jgi:hypothetical protein
LHALPVVPSVAIVVEPASSTTEPPASSIRWMIVPASVSDALLPPLLLEQPTATRLTSPLTSRDPTHL